MINEGLNEPRKQKVTKLSILKSVINSWGNHSPSSLKLIGVWGSLIIFPLQTIPSKTYTSDKQHIQILQSKIIWDTHSLLPEHCVAHPAQ